MVLVGYWYLYEVEGGLVQGPGVLALDWERSLLPGMMEWDLEQELETGTLDLEGPK